MKCTSDREKMTSKEGTETTLHHSGTQNKHIWTRIEHYTARIDYNQDLYNKYIYIYIYIKYMTLYHNM